MPFMLAFLLFTGVNGNTYNKGGGYGGFGVYLQMFDFSSINNFFKSHGIKELENNLYGWGGGGYGLTNRTLIGGFGMWMQGRTSSDSVSVETEFGMGAFEAGYDILDWGFFSFLGGVGLGGGSIEMTLKPILNDVTFDSLLNNPKRYAKIKFSTFTLSPFALILISPFNSPISFALKGGYTYGIGGKWKLDDGSDLLSPPNFKLRGPYFSINIFFGGRETTTYGG